MYTVFVSTVILVGLLNQIILISQNITQQELRNAARNGQTRCGMIMKNNYSSRGIRRNWLDFWSGRRFLQYTKTPHHNV